jgi:hypothetical protein
VPVRELSRLTRDLGAFLNLEQLGVDALRPVTRRLFL